jgi:hypothetical protein
MVIPNVSRLGCARPSDTDIPLAASPADEAKVLIGRAAAESSDRDSLVDLAQLAAIRDIMMGRWRSSAIAAGDLLTIRNQPGSPTEIPSSVNRRLALPMRTFTRKQSVFLRPNSSPSRPVARAPRRLIIHQPPFSTTRKAQRGIYSVLWVSFVSQVISIGVQCGLMINCIIAMGYSPTRLPKDHLFLP